MGCAARHCRVRRGNSLLPLALAVVVMCTLMCTADASTLPARMQCSPFDPVNSSGQD